MNPIQQFRLKHRLSQSQLAKLLQVNVRSVQRWENGQREPHTMTYALIEKLDVELSKAKS